MEQILPASARGFDPWSRKMPHAAEQLKPMSHGQEQPHERKPSSSTEDPAQPNTNQLINFKKKKSNSERHSVPERALYTSYVAKRDLKSSVGRGRAMQSCNDSMRGALTYL